jgi:hypothetical protein
MHMILEAFELLSRRDYTLCMERFRDSELMLVGRWKSGALLRTLILYRLQSIGDHTIDH